MDLKNSSKHIDSAISIDRKNGYSLTLKGKIKIEEQEYEKAISLFKQAISLDLGNLRIIIWDAYAKCLKAELSYASNKKNLKI